VKHPATCRRKESGNSRADQNPSEAQGTTCKERILKSDAAKVKSQIRKKISPSIH